MPGCGGGTNPFIDTGQPKRSIITQRNWALDPLDVLTVDINITGVGNGTLDTTAEWTS